jgi:hypothetical protein
VKMTNAKGNRRIESVRTMNPVVFLSSTAR